jgi:hypothetical protein
MNIITEYITILKSVCHGGGMELECVVCTLFIVAWGRENGGR